ncbi:hypothetical protein LX36DRAFT_17369 [Colletotrichum falcatum]|nr:hypothetical protein LX36DRAFT_17369 [Colletotrichum falcatum]
MYALERGTSHYSLTHSFSHHPCFLARTEHDEKSKGAISISPLSPLTKGWRILLDGIGPDTRARIAAIITVIIIITIMIVTWRYAAIGKSSSNIPLARVLIRPQPVGSIPLTS